MCLCVLKLRQDSQEARNLNTAPVSHEARAPSSELHFLCEFSAFVGSAQIMSVQLFSFDQLIGSEMETGLILE